MELATQTALVKAAQAGDQRAFEAMVEPYQRELLVHCYRMLGSFHDAEDLLQETLVRAWEKCETFTSPGSFRAWMYRIATNLCLNTLTRQPRRSLPPRTHAALDPAKPLPPRQNEPIWLEPFPDELLADHWIEPEQRALQREYTTLAFLVALQQLTPTQRAVLLLREVLDWPANDVAEWLNFSVPATNSALQRARRTLRQLHAFPENPFELESPELQTLLENYVNLWEQADIPGLVKLLQEDAWFTMPPIPGWYKGRANIAASFKAVVFARISTGKWRLLATRANGRPAFAIYRREIGDHPYHLFGLLVLDVVGGQIASIVAFLDLPSLVPFALPPTLDG
jgi:RNA polymerase sigma-70 factor (ECF subfamily)